jgi:hypothetical protein
VRYRWLKIDYSSFGKTRHWLRGAAFVDYVFRESGYQQAMAAQLFSPSPLLARLKP